MQVDMASLAGGPRWRNIYRRKRKSREEEFRVIELYYKNSVLPVGACNYTECKNFHKP